MSAPDRRDDGKEIPGGAFLFELETENLRKIDLPFTSVVSAAWLTEEEILVGHPGTGIIKVNVDTGDTQPFWLIPEDMKGTASGRRPSGGASTDSEEPQLQVLRLPPRTTVRTRRALNWPDGSTTRLRLRLWRAGCDRIGNGKTLATDSH